MYTFREKLYVCTLMPQIIPLLTLKLVCMWHEESSPWDWHSSQVTILVQLFLVEKSRSRSSLRRFKDNGELSHLCMWWSYPWFVFCSILRTTTLEVHGWIRTSMQATLDLEWRFLWIWSPERSPQWGRSTLNRIGYLVFDTLNTNVYTKYQ